MSLTEISQQPRGALWSSRFKTMHGFTAPPLVWYKCQFHASSSLIFGRKILFWDLRAGEPTVVITNPSNWANFTPKSLWITSHSYFKRLLAKNIQPLVRRWINDDAEMSIYGICLWMIKLKTPNTSLFCYSIYIWPFIFRPPLSWRHVNFLFSPDLVASRSTSSRSPPDPLAAVRP